MGASAGTGSSTRRTRSRLFVGAVQYPERNSDLSGSFLRLNREKNFIAAPLNDRVLFRTNGPRRFQPIGEPLNGEEQRCEGHHDD